MRAALLACAAVLLFAPTAYAQNSQFQAGDVNAQTTINVGAAHDAGATAIGAGNVVTSTSEGDEELENLQHMDGDASANTDASVWNATGTVAVTSAVVANGGTAIAGGGDVDVDTTQLAHGDASARATFNGGNAHDTSVGASASGNVAAVSLEDGQVRFVGSQESTGAVVASTEANQDGVSGVIVSGAISSSNNLTIGGETATVLTDTVQSAAGSSAARSDLYVGYAYDASGNAIANANANSATIDNQWGYVNAAIDQRSEANVTADAYVTLGGDFVGFASAGAYGVGNQALVSNVGSDTVMETIQTNSGDVSANAAMSGEGGGMALASSAAYGNNVTGSLCGYCDTNVAGLTATNSQSNDGEVTSTARVNTPYAHTVGASSTAIGNAATYQVAGPTN